MRKNSSKHGIRKESQEPDTACDRNRRMKAPWHILELDLIIFALVTTINGDICE